jgi:hypothetical protein
MMKAPIKPDQPNQNDIPIQFVKTIRRQFRPHPPDALVSSANG